MHCSSQCAPACTASTALNLDWNLKPKLAIMCQCTSVTDRRTDRWTLTSYHKRKMYILHLVLKMCKVGPKITWTNNSDIILRHCCIRFAKLIRILDVRSLSLFKRTFIMLIYIYLHGTDVLCHFNWHVCYCICVTFITLHFFGTPCRPGAIPPYPGTSPPASLFFRIFSFFPFLIHASSIFLLFIPSNSTRIVPLHFHTRMS